MALKLLMIGFGGLPCLKQYAGKDCVLGVSGQKEQGSNMDWANLKVKSHRGLDK
jgi:hypothetical protein